MDTSRWAAVNCSHLPHFERILCAFNVAQPSSDALGLATLIAQRFGASLETLSVKSGSPTAAILARASLCRADLVVLGSRLRSDLGWQFRDDVVRDVSALADCCTLTVHERDSPAALERMLVPVDFGPTTEATLERASSLALRFEAKVQLLHVVSHESFDATARLSALRQRLCLLGVDATAEVAVSSSVAGGIESYNQRAEFDLVLMGSSGGTPSRSTRGVIATLRNRLSVPLLAVRSALGDVSLAGLSALETAGALETAAGARLSA